MKAEKALYGPVNKRGLFGKIDYWNKLVALPINDEYVPEYLACYEPDKVTHVKDYDYSGPIGTSADYPAYKKALEDRREANRQRMLMLQDSEKNWYKRRARLWSKGRKLARENIKALKEGFEAEENPLNLLHSILKQQWVISTRMLSLQLRLVILTTTMMLLLMK